MATSKISAIFSSNTSGLVAGTKAAGAAFDRLANDVKGLRGQLGTLNAIAGAQLFGQVAAGVKSAVSSFYSMSSAASQSVDVLSKLASRTGSTYESISGLALAGDLAGVGVDAISGAMTKADRAFVLAAEGSKSATEAFKRVGLSVADLQGKSAAERFQLIAEAISALPTEAERAAASVALFGKSGADLLPMFADGADGIRQATELAQRFGLAVNSVQGKNVEAMNDSWTLVQKAIEGVITQVVANLAPAVTAINTAFTDFVSGFGGKSIGESIADAIMAGAEYLAGVADWFIANVPEVFRFAETIGSYWGTVVDLFSRAISGAQGVFKMFEIAGNAVGMALSKIAAGFLTIVADAASIIPGMGEFAKAAKASASGWEEQAAAYGQAMSANMTEAGKLFADTFGDRAKEGGERAAGPVTTAFQGVKAQMEAARTAPSEETKTKVEPPPPEVVIDEAKLAKGLDSRSSAGVNEMLRLMQPPGSGQSYEKENNRLFQQIADNTADAGIEFEQVDM